MSVVTKRVSSSAQNLKQDAFLMQVSEFLTAFICDIFLGAKHMVQLLIIKGLNSPWNSKAWLKTFLIEILNELD